MANIEGRDLFVKHLKPNGETFVTQHRVWDASKFITTLQKENAALPDKEKCIIQQTTQQEFNSYKGR